MTPARRIGLHVGNRGAVLALLGVIWVVLATTSRTGPQRPVLLHERLPLWANLVLWAVPGLVALVAVWWRRIDATAWGLLIAGPLVRLTSYWWGWVTGLYPAGWRGFLVWLLVALLVNRCAAGLDRPLPWDGRERRWTQASGQ